ncbi:MAG: death-on-curing protein [Gemmatimonadetes bacterium RBG_16_66_8]|nr:MAG: death-on-curing protein [Gemmatimonadetes bacterium RBG_16_66_8]
MQEPHWLDRRAVEAIQADLLNRHGGRPGVRDEHLLESALARPRTNWGYQPDMDLAALAAAYGYGLARNHAFVDGNKRIAFMAMFVLLGLNGYELDAPEPEVVRIMLDVASGAAGEQQMADWVRSNSKAAA